MNAALGNDMILPMPDPETVARAAARVNAPRKPAPLRPFDDIAVERIRITGPTLTLLQDLLARQDEEFYGAQIHTRTRLDNGTLYPLLKKLHKAGWLTSRPEAEESWLGRAPVGCGPGRRRTYYALTTEGLRATAHEVQHRSTPSPKKGCP
ncbi:PadR family transcriptional regulator [Streptomyces niveus]|uniref:PadR family transcriptional regulator n=1 Tax=Streptomyces niveus TaxID=193462 RepID=UPI0035DFC016